VTDIQTVEATPDIENIHMEKVAKSAAEVLSRHYPDHIWMVGWAPGMTLVIKNMAISDGRYGFTVDAARSFSSSDLDKLIANAGGELLERCGVPRSRWNGEFMHLENKT